MTSEANSGVERRVAMHAALADPGRLRIVDQLSVGDASPSELGELMGMPSNLIAFHVKVLEEAGLVTGHRSEGDRRRRYLRLVPGSLDGLGPSLWDPPRRVVFVCTANTARSQLAAALWRQACGVPVASAGTHPADRVAPGARTVAARHRLPMPRVTPRHVDEVLDEGDLVVTVCDRAHEELGDHAARHWSVPDPVPVGTDTAFESAYSELSSRVTAMADRLHVAP